MCFLDLRNIQISSGLHDTFHLLSHFSVRFHISIPWSIVSFPWFSLSFQPILADLQSLLGRQFLCIQHMNSYSFMDTFFFFFALLCFCDTTFSFLVLLGLTSFFSILNVVWSSWVIVSSLLYSPWIILVNYMVLKKICMLITPKFVLFPVKLPTLYFLVHV